MSDAELDYTLGQDGGSPLLVTQTRTCSQCGSAMYPGFSLSGMWVNFTHLIKNRWICDSGHIYDEE